MKQELGICKNCEYKSYCKKNKVYCEEYYVLLDVLVNVFKIQTKSSEK